MDWLYDAEDRAKRLGVALDKIRIRTGTDLLEFSVELDTAGQYKLIEYLVGRIREKEARKVDERLKKILEAR